MDFKINEPYISIYINNKKIFDLYWGLNNDVIECYRENYLNIGSYGTKYGIYSIKQGEHGYILSNLPNKLYLNDEEYNKLKLEYLDYYQKKLNQ